MANYFYQIPPPPFPAHNPNHTISAYDRYHGTLDGSWRGGWGDRNAGTFSWKDPYLRVSSYSSNSLADFRRREGATARKERLRRVYNSLKSDDDKELKLLPSNISWYDFCQYVYRQEIELWNIYKDLDINNDMKLDKEDLRLALRKAKINPNQSSFDDFFNSLDQDNKGVIEFADFRDYLLLLPQHPHISEIYRYYTLKSQSQLTSDADVIVSPDVSRDSPLDSHKEVEKEEEDEEEEDSSTSSLLGGSQAARFLLAGGIAGAVSRTATAPFDRLKVYLITSTKKTNMSGITALYSAMQKIYHQGGGVSAFWVGNGLNIVKIFPESAIKFLSYETAKRVFAKHWDKVDDQSEISGTSRFVAGGVGGITSQLSIYPIETTKTRMMTSASNTSKARVLHTMKDIYLKSGFTAFYRGLPAGLFGVFPYSGEYFRYFLTED